MAEGTQKPELLTSVIEGGKHKNLTPWDLRLCLPRRGRDLIPSKFMNEYDTSECGFKLSEEGNMLFSASGNNDPFCEDSLFLVAVSTGYGQSKGWSGVLLLIKCVFFVEEHSFRMPAVYWGLLPMLRCSEQLFWSNSCAQGRVTLEQRLTLQSLWEGDQGPFFSCSS